MQLDEPSKLSTAFNSHPGGETKVAVPGKPPHAPFLLPPLPVHALCLPRKKTLHFNCTCSLLAPYFV